MQLLGVAQYRNGTLAEKKLDINIKVEDENDNSPVFKEGEHVEVYELRPAGSCLYYILHNSIIVAFLFALDKTRNLR